MFHCRYATVYSAMSTFAELGLASPLVEALTSLGYEEPTPIQADAIPALLAGRDLLGQAATGTGKTAAFALPLLQRLATTAPVPLRPALLVLVPTRELAMQVAEAFHRYGRALGTSVVPIYGGQPFSAQIKILRRGVHVVVATPGRALDHIRRKTLDLAGLAAVVLDEADEMLDMGFAEDLESILDAAPERRQTALFSATLPPRITVIAERHLNDPVRIRIAGETTAAGNAPRVRQVAYLVSRAQKVAALGRILDLEAPTLALVFCRTRTEVDALTATLGGHGFRAEALHGGMTQDARDRVMKRTRAGSVDLLVATDVAARGLDIDHLSHVVNFNVPESPAAYVHRIGRTGRAGREGVAITFVEPREHRMLRSIEGVTRQKITVSQLPTAVDVQARRLGLTTASLRETIVAGKSDHYRVAVESLTDEFDLMTIAMAAVQLAHERGGGLATRDDAELDLPAEPVAPRARREASPAAKSTRPPRTRGMARIYVGAGRKHNLRPTDLVGAITNEAGIEAREIGTIEITDKFSLVELPEERIELVVRALRASTIKGKRLTVRRDLAGR
jgi:ATP-dependent RNA helicase DeaD